MSDHDPFAPKRVVVATVPQHTSHLPTERLERLGASPIVVEEARARWAAMTQQERRESLTALGAMTDDEVRESLPGMEASLVAALVLGSVDDGLVEEALTHVGDKVGGTAKEIERYVDDDRARALAALVMELRRPESARRKTVVEHLEAVLRRGG